MATMSAKLCCIALLLSWLWTSAFGATQVTPDSAGTLLTSDLAVTQVTPDPAVTLITHDPPVTLVTLNPAVTLVTPDIGFKLFTSAVAVDDTITSVAAADNTITSAVAVDNTITSAAAADNTITSAAAADNTITSAAAADNTIKSAVATEETKSNLHYQPLSEAIVGLFQHIFYSDGDEPSSVTSSSYTSTTVYDISYKSIFILVAIKVRNKISAEVYWHVN